MLSASLHCRMLEPLVPGYDCGLGIAIQLSQLVPPIHWEGGSCVGALEIACRSQRDFGKQTWAIQHITIVSRQRLGIIDQGMLAGYTILHHACSKSHAVIR